MGSDDLASFYFAHDELFVIPVEHLAPEGMSEAFARMLQERRGLGGDWVALFDGAFRTYYGRCLSIHQRAPKSWLPPRLQNVCVVTHPEATRPYYQPFDGSSWYVYASDFDPATSNEELGAFLFVLSERLGLTRQIAHAIVHTTGYVLTLDPPALDALERACRLTTRPDREAFAALADALPSMRAVYHDELRPLVLELLEPTKRIEAAALTVPASAGGPLQALARRFNQAAREVAERYFAWQARPRDHSGSGGAAASAPVDRVCAFLAERRPTVLLAGEGGEEIWDPDRPDAVDRAREALEGICERAADSLCADLEVVGEHTDRFLASVVTPDALGTSDELDQAGGTYLHHARRIVVYSLEQPGLRPLAEAAPPYHRFLLGARTLHEWGHLAADAGWVRVPDARRDELERVQRELAKQLDAIIASAPPALASIGRREVELLRSEGFTLADMPMKRMGDYQANLLARRYLSTPEMESYIRANIKSHHQERVGPYLLLTRYAYELQYLKLSRMADPLAYFFGSTWFGEHFVERGVVTREAALELFDTVGALCACFEVDESAFRSGAASRRS